MQFNTKKPLGVFSLAMINVIAVDSLRSLPAGAEYGFALVFFYVLAALLFFIPSALVSAELATAWPNTGGSYVWIRAAFGRSTGLFAIWLQWIYNVVWYPTILSFIAVTLAYLINPALVSNKFYVLGVILVAWWLATGLNCLGLNMSSWVSMFGAIVGTMIPMAVITVLGIIWLKSDKISQVVFSAQNLLPNLGDLRNLGFLTTVIFGLMGLEMSAVHAGDVKNPQRDYPRALLMSVLLILSTLVFASLAIAVVIPSNQLSVLTGLTDAYELFFQNHHLAAWAPVIIALIVMGSFSGVSTWVIGPTRGLLIALQENQVGETWQKLNKFGMPSRLLVLQGVIVTILSSIFILAPNVSSAYWLLSVMAAQLALIFYFFLFAAAIRLRYKESDKPRAYRIPGGKAGMWIVAGLGVLSCVATFSFGFMPPLDLETGSLWRFEMILISGIIVFCIFPWWLYCCYGLAKQKS